MSARANPLHSASAANRKKRAFRAEGLLFPSKNLNMALLDVDVVGTCCQGIIPRSWWCKPTSLPGLAMEDCRLLVCRGRRDCELASSSVRYLWPTAPTRIWNLYCGSEVAV